MTLAAWVVKAYTGEWLDPWQMLPSWLRPPAPPEPPRSPERERHDTECALVLIGEALKLRA